MICLPDTTLIVKGALLKARNSGTEYVIDEKSEVITRRPGYPFFVFAGLDAVKNEGTGRSRDCLLAPAGHGRSHPGTAGPAMSGTSSSPTGRPVFRVVLWGDRALLPLVRGDQISLYNARLKQGRTGEP